MELQKWKKKKEKAENEGDLSLLFSACKELAEIYFRDEKYDLALKEYKEMERVSDAQNNKMDVARCNRMIGEVYCEKGEFSKAIKHQIQHLKISKEQNDKVEEQRALATLGRTYFLRAETCEVSYDKENAKIFLNEAKKYFLQSLNVCDILDQSVSSKQTLEMKSRLFLNLGLVFECQKQRDEAEKHLSKAVLICKKLDLYEDLFRSYAALGSLYQKNKEMTKALSTFDLAIPVAERLSNKSQSVCEILILKSEGLIDQSNFRGARQALLRAYKIHAPMESMRSEIERKLRIVAAMCETEEKLLNIPPDSNYEARKKLYEDLADMLSELGNFDLSAAYYHLMLDCVEKSGGDKKSLIESYVSLAQSYKDDKQYDKAIEYFTKELTLEEDDPCEACKTCMNIADIYNIKDNPDMMLDMYKKAKKYAESSNKKRKLVALVLKAMHGVLTERNNFLLADQVNKELQDFIDPFDDSSDDDNDESTKEFGSHINLEDLSDPELGEDDNDKTKVSRTRVKSKPNIQKRNEKGETPLHLAAISGNANLASKLIDQGHSVDIRDYTGWTPLHEACNHGNKEVVEVLLKNGASVNDRGGPFCEGVTPLLDAASNGSFDCIELLLEYGAKPLMKTNNEDTVLDCLSGWRERRLNECGTDLDPLSLTRYNYLYQKLQETLEKAGHKTKPKEHKTNQSTRTRSKYDQHQKKPCSKWMDIIENDDPRTESATNEYDCAMKALRYKNRPDPSPMVVQKPNIPALLNTDETVDDWLDDDLLIARPNKKRRTNEFIGEPLRKTDQNKTRPISPSNGVFIDEDSNQEFRSESPVNSVPSPIDITSPSTSGICSNKLKERNANRKKQISLMDSGVTKEKMAKTNSFQDVYLASSAQPSQPQQQSQPMSYVKVKIEDKLLLVPIPNSCEDKTVSWLAVEASQRYRSLEGVEPVLRLVTQDGAILCDSDPISLVIHMGDLVGQVQNWNLPSLPAIYEETCANNDISVDKQILNVLEASQATCKVSLDSMYLDWKNLAPLIKAISHHQSLQELELSGNYIGDSNMKEIAECIVKLENLQVLDISNINITSSGLNIFAQIVQKNRALQQLQVLNLGFNPLNDCLKPLSDLLNTIPTLTTLRIESVGLTNQSFQSFQCFTLDCLQFLNINFNKIGDEGVIDLLGRLDSRNIVDLRLAGTSDTAVREVAFYLQNNTPSSLTVLDLSYCNKTDHELQELIKGVNLCPKLEKLILDSTPGSPCNILPLANLSTVRDLSVCGLQANQVFQQVENHMASLSIGSCIEQPWGRPGPFGYYTNRDTTTH